MEGETSMEMKGPFEEGQAAVKYETVYPKCWKQAEHQLPKESSDTEFLELRKKTSTMVRGKVQASIYRVHALFLKMLDPLNYE